MNVGKLKRVAIKEFTRSPAKSCTLLALLPVALYFIVPLLIGGGKGNTTSAAGTNDAKAAGTADFLLPAASASGATVKRGPANWMSVAGWIENDSLTLPADFASDVRNPFVQPPKPEPTAVAQDDEPEPDAEEGLTKEELEAIEAKRDAIAKSNDPIAELGLQLNATMVGKRSRLATVNGKTYEQGEVIPVIIIEDSGDAIELDDEATVEKEVTLLHVDRRFVVVEMEGQRKRLQLRNEFPEDAIVIRPRSK